MTLPLTLLVVALFTLCLSSVLEGLFHQFILHRAQKRLFGGALVVAYHKHSNEHHPQFRGDQYHRDAPEDEHKISLGPLLFPSALILTSPVSVGLWFVSPWASGTFVGVMFAYYMAYEFLHWHMHFTRPDGRPRFYHAWPPSRQLFEWFDKRHYLHHDADDRNFNVVLPVYDLACGRYTTREGVDPWAVRRRKRRAAERSAQLRLEAERSKSA